MMIGRRDFMKCGAAASIGSAAYGWGETIPAQSPAKARTYHLCTGPEALEADPDLLTLVAESGVDTIWLAGFFYGHWPYPPERIQEWRQRIERLGLPANVVNVPLGHPGDSLGSSSDTMPLTPPGSWRPARASDGRWYAGTSLHPPATQENAEALRQLAALGVKNVFLDDDFRLARAPGTIGGCFCDEHRDAFLRSHGYGEPQWSELLDSVQARRLTPVLRAWIESACNELTACFRAQQAAAPEATLGIMIMYLGAEKAGIRLADYHGVPMRVGELMFDDETFGKLKNKTNELFSCLFHRRFVSPALAYSETTAFPADKLSAKNMAAKLAVSTLADVRNTMFMSGITPFPRAHWQTLAPAMKKHAAIHTQIAGHTLRGPFKHYWGEASRYVSDDNPYSLFLAAGVPFEVVDTPGQAGWTFLGGSDAAANLQPGEGICVAWPAARPDGTNIRAVEETLPALFALKRELLPTLHATPYIEEEKPVVCGWYPTAESVVLWNLAEQRETFTLHAGGARIPVTVDGLDIELISGVRVD